MADNKPQYTEDYINKIYDAQNQAQQAALESSYAANLSNLDAAQQKTQQATDANLTRTAVEAQKANNNYNEVQNAYGLSSGAMAQARLARDNTLAADSTALRTAQQNADAEFERQKTLAADQFKAALMEAQKSNDAARYQQLLQMAKEEEARLRSEKQAAAQTMAGVGDFTRLGELYGYSTSELALLKNAYAAANAPKTSTTSSYRYSGEPPTEDNSPIVTVPKLGDVSSFAGKYANVKADDTNPGAQDNVEKAARAAIESVIASYYVAQAKGLKTGSFEDWMRQNGIVKEYDMELARQMFKEFTPKGG